MAYSFVYLVRKNFSLLFCKNIHKILVATRILILASRKRPRPVDVCATLSENGFFLSNLKYFSRAWSVSWSWAIFKMIYKCLAMIDFKRETYGKSLFRKFIDLNVFLKIFPDFLHIPTSFRYRPPFDFLSIVYSNKILVLLKSWKTIFSQNKTSYFLFKPTKI